MNRYWISWYSGNYADEGCTSPPFEHWVTGQRDRPQYGLTDEQYKKFDTLRGAAKDSYLDKHARDDCTICAIIDAVDEDAAWKQVKTHFPDFVPRFVEIKEADWRPGQRFC